MEVVNQKEYLKKYLSGNKDGKKKKRKKKDMVPDRLKIIDDDIDMSQIAIGVNEDLFGANEDAPQIVGVIDDRPMHMRIDDYRKSDLWKPLGGEPAPQYSLNSTDNIVIKTEKEVVIPPQSQDKSDSSPPRRKLLPGDKKGKYLIPAKRMAKTLDGKTAGLQNARELVKENEAFRKREEDLFKNMSTDVSGVNAPTVLRDRKTGKIRDLKKEKQEREAKEKQEDVNKEKYTRWGKGLKQVEDYENKLQEDLHEMNKPLARYADDEDLERFLKEKEREGDPMLSYIRKKRRKNDIETGKPIKQQFEGEFMPNRFGVRPGHRWDGVNRSNGYEKKWIEVQNAKHAQQEEVYKWSTEDM